MNIKYSFISAFLVMSGFALSALSQPADTNSVNGKLPINEPWVSVSNQWSAVPFASARQAAQNGDIRAQYFLAVCYGYGYGVAKDMSEALKWTRATADKGYAKGQVLLGLFFEKGTGVTQDYAEAARLYRMAADQGNARAQNYLGSMYVLGRGVKKDPVEAVKWYQKSADQGDELGESNLGWMYGHGQGVERNYELAEKWMRKSAEQGSASLQYRFAQMLVDELDKDNHQAGDFPAAAEWYRKAADQEYADAQYELAGLFYYGKLGYDYNEAIKWYTKAAENGKTDAIMKLGELYKDNHSNFPRNHVESARWYKKAAEAGDAEAQYQLALLLLEGDLPHDPAEAEHWLKQAAASGHVEAGLKLASPHKESKDTVLQQFNREELEAASENSWGSSLLLVGTAYEEGRGGPADARSAAGMYLRLFQGGPAQDRIEAATRLVNLYYTGKIKPEKKEHPADFDQRGFAFKSYVWTAPESPEQLAQFLEMSKSLLTIAQARYQVGEMFYEGKVLPANKRKAVEWLTLASQAGSAEAMNRLGELWAAGIGGVPNAKEAVNWYRKAALKGLAAAQLNLGSAFEKGNGIEQNSQEAYAWYRLAANEGSETARKDLDRVGSKLSPAERDVAKSRADALLKQIVP